VIVFTEKRFEEKLQKIGKGQAIQYFYLDYPEIPYDAGSDNDPVLSAPNAAFFQVLYPKQLPAGFDFSGKKTAILDTRDDPENPQWISIGAYVAKVRENLLLQERFYPDYIYLLNADQKQLSGGYNIVIQYMKKDPVPLEELVKFLGKTNGN
jgi:hypothetical protein